MLPKQNSVVYTLTIPSSKIKVKFRPFLVKEHKSLMVAQQSEDMSVMVDTLKQIVTNCVLDPIDIESLAVFDLEYILVKIRAKSISEKVELLLLCDADKSHNRAKVELDLDTFEPTYTEGHEKNILLFDDVGVIMKYPSLDIINLLDKQNPNSAEEMAISCIDCIYDDKNVYSTKDQSKEELIEFLDNLTVSQLAKIEKFFSTMPKVEKSITYKCPDCGIEHTKIIKGFSNFF